MRVCSVMVGCGGTVRVCEGGGEEGSKVGVRVSGAEGRECERWNEGEGWAL